MAMQIQDTVRKRMKPGMMWGGVFLLAGLLLLGSVAPVGAAEVGEDGASTDQAAPCKGLKPYNNLDELLYQFYINLDSDCLFTMPTADLEKIWGIKILDEERAKPKNYYPLSETEFYNKPYKSEKDAFYVARTYDAEIGINIFTIYATQEYAEKPMLGLFNEYIPQYLPEIGTNNTKAFPCGALASPSNQGAPCYRWNYPNMRAMIELLPLKVKIHESQSKYKQKKKRYIPLSEDTLAAELAALKLKESGPATANLKTDPCRGLKPFNNIDELLYQFYINLDSYCLFDMPVEELERVWNTKILSDERVKQTGVSLASLREGSDFAGKPYRSEQDAFFLEIRQAFRTNTRIFQLDITDEYFKKYASLFPAGNYPKLLPEPIINHRKPPIPPPRREGNYDFDLEDYYWVNGDQPGGIVLGGTYGVLRVTMVKKSAPAPLSEKTD